MSKEIRLVTFQSLDAIKDLFKKGFLEADESKINKEKVGYVYDWISEKMSNVVENPENTKYPLWCWVKCYNSVCPPKRKGKPVDGFDVKITFKKNKRDVFITDFIRYSFLLNNTFIPSDLIELKNFEEELKKYDITHEDLIAYVRKDKYKSHRNDKEFLSICQKIRKSFDKCITTNSKILQGCVWRIYLEEIEKIEIVKDDGYTYGSLNYVRSNGKRMDWIKEYYKSLK